MKGLDALDWVVIALYFIILLGVAWWVIKQKQTNTEDYFLAGRNIGWFMVGASIFASNIGSEHVVGLAGNGAGDKIPLLIYELHAWIVLMLGWVFLPFYARSGVFTMPEFLEKRFDARSRWVLSIVSLIAYILTKVSVTIYAGGVVVSALVGNSFLDWCCCHRSAYGDLYGTWRNARGSLYRDHSSHSTCIGRWYPDFFRIGCRGRMGRTKGNHWPRLF